MKSSKIKLAGITVDAPSASKTERLVINDFFHECNNFEEFVRNKFQLNSLEAYVLAKSLIENYQFLIDDNPILLEMIKCNAAYVKENLADTKHQETNVLLIPPEEIN